MPAWRLRHRRAWRAGAILLDDLSAAFDHQVVGSRSRQDDPVTPALAEDGVFGPLTKASLVTFQSSATNHRYAHAFAYRDDPDRFIHLVALAGYATDPNYEQKIKSIMAANGLKDYDTKLGGRRIYNDAVSVGVFA